MVENRKLSPRNPNRQRRAFHLEFQEYVVGISGWDWSYSLSLDKSRQRSEPYHEFRHLVIKGILLQPTLRIDQVEVTLLPNRNLDEERRKHHEPISIGTLELRDDKMVGLIPMPMDALSPVLLMLICNRFKFLAMSGTEMYRRSTRLSGFRLEMTLEEEEEAP
ncbi:hypothetical protein [Bradyrhizobium sp. UNPA324]|uniref:hypothetical protein n=1 Tax=Bradyrhizobium sp. UNPA324 TaxID=1141174 RepID=UPI00115334E9|nr:hypothetical protein [Bradyrhizobium sp. UNPA324]TQF29762.1 hypothetical protein UNPA324_09150 [Bradyrhizobium sp. UNPA324]